MIDNETVIYLTNVKCAGERKNIFSVLAQEVKDYVCSVDDDVVNIPVRACAAGPWLSVAGSFWHFQNPDWVLKPAGSHSLHRRKNLQKQQWFDSNKIQVTFITTAIILKSVFSGSASRSKDVFHVKIIVLNSNSQVTCCSLHDAYRVDSGWVLGCNKGFQSGCPALLHTSNLRQLHENPPGDIWSALDCYRLWPNRKPHNPCKDNKTEHFNHNIQHLLMLSKIIYFLIIIGIIKTGQQILVGQPFHHSRWQLTSTTSESYKNYLDCKQEVIYFV